jgi:peptide/nickel transport system substrate-binding protein
VTRSGVLALLATTALLSTFGCSRGAATSERAPAHRVVRIAFSYAFPTLNPILNNGFPGAALNTLAFSYLLRLTPEGHLEPDAATVVPTLRNGGVSPDGRTITYHLRPAMRWQDGAPLTSADVAFTERAIMNPRNTIGSRSPYDRVASIETPDATTVRVRLRSADAAILPQFLTPDANAAILPAHLLARYASLDRVPFDALPIGSGPYRVIAWQRGASLRLASNPLYYGGAPRLAGIELRYVPDTSTALVQLQTGELDAYVHADETYYARYEKLTGKTLTSVPFVGASSLTFNVRKPLLAQVALRRALSQAVDAPSLVRDAFRGALTASDATRGLFSYADDPSAGWPRYDPAAAAHALDALGWKRDASGIRHRAGSALAFTLIYDNVSTAEKTAAVILQQQLGAAGVRVDLQGFTHTQFDALPSDGGPLLGARFDLALEPLSTDVDPDQTWLLSCHERSPNGYNAAGYCSPEVDALLAAASKAFDPDRRIAIIKHIQRIVAHDVPFLPLWQVREIDVMPRWLHGFTPNGNQPFESARNWSAND